MKNKVLAFVFAAALVAFAPTTNSAPAPNAAFTANVVTADHKAVPWEHVLVDLGMAGQNCSVTVMLPVVAKEGDYVRVSEVSADGGIGCGGRLMVSGPSSSAVPGGTVLFGNSNYVVANDGFGLSKQHAMIEAVWKLDGWIVTAESAKP